MAYEQTIGTIDFGFLPPNFHCDVQAFFTSNNGQGSQKWVKPRGVTMCHMICIGGGGGGGGGFQANSTNARGGGAGGACSGVAKLIIPALLLPDVLWVQVGNGGTGGTGGTSPTAGGNGTNSFISYGAGITAISTIPNIILQSGINAPGGGNAGANSGAATGGTVPTIATAAAQGAATSCGIPAFIVGLVGAAGGTPTAAGSAITAVWNLISLSPGTGGGGVTAVNTGFAGGALSLQSALDFADGTMVPAASYLAGGVAGGAGAAGNGNSGVQLFKPFYMTGGTGGGSSDKSTGGNGGKGGIGCGGGGGGAGATAGNGGSGGDGFVQIISW